MQGAWIGVPFNYFYKSTDDIDKSKIQINGKPIDWDSNDGTLLESSLVLTVKEQLFVFCRSLLELDFFKHLYSTSIWAGAWIVARSMAEHNNKKYKMFRKPYYVSDEITEKVKTKRKLNFVLIRIADQICNVSAICSAWLCVICHCQRFLYIYTRENG